MNKHTLKIITAAVVLFVSVYLSGCKKTEIKSNTTDDVNIVGYLDRNVDSFSLFRQILERTETAAFLNAYGAYTCFAVTNSGVKTWLTGMGAASVDAADLNVLKDMVRLHLLNDTITTNSFTDGKMPVITMYGQFLITGVTTKYGVASYLINRQGFVLQSNIRVGNGIIHVIDNVLQPAKLTLAKTLEADPKYSIFLQAVRETGFYDLLNKNNNPDPTKTFLTLLAESNTALADSGITSYAQLKARYSRTGGNPALATDSLNLYVAYHIVPGIYFLADIIQNQAQVTFAPQEVISTKFVNQQVLINDDVFNGIAEPGILLKKATSDVQATNGVLHDPKSHFNLKIRKPTALYWDVSSFAEVRSKPAIYKRQNLNFFKTVEADVPIKDIYWPHNSTNFLTYTYGTGGSLTNYACNNDVNQMSIGLPSRPAYYDYKSPVVIKGRYKVWICYRSNGGQPCNVFFNGQPMQRSFSFAQARPAGGDGELEAIFYKRYTENTSNLWVGRMVGIVDVPTTGQHTIRMAAFSGSFGNNNYLDMIHFIPVDDNQVFPRFKPDGTQLFQ